MLLASLRKFDFSYVKQKASPRGMMVLDLTGMAVQRSQNGVNQHRNIVLKIFAVPEEKQAKNQQHRICSVLTHMNYFVFS